MRAAKRSPNTIRQYKQVVKLFTGWLDEQRLGDIFDVDRLTIVQYLAECQSKYAPSTVHAHYAVLKSLFKWLHAEGFRDTNPSVGVPVPDIPDVEKDVVSAEKMGEVLKSLDADKKYRDAAIISLFYDTGMRASEVAGLKWDDVNWDEGVVVLRNDRTRRTKASEDRVVPFGPSTFRRLERWQRQRKDRNPYVFVSLGGNRRGQAITRSGYLQIVKETFERFGVQGIGPHDLRHTFATHFIEDESARESDLKTIAGWKSDRMLERYTKTRRVARAVAAHRRLSPVERLA